MDKGKSLILIVDDTLLNLQFLQEILVKQGYEVQIAHSGKIALRKVVERTPDLILLDIQMPAMDGYEVCEQLKANENFRGIPVIFVSALDKTFDKVKAFAVGGVDYVTKPFETMEVLARVKTHLSLHRLQKETQMLNQRLHTLLRQFATKEVADDLLAQGFSLGGKNMEITAMFVDIRSFTAITESQSPELTVELLNDYYTHVMEIITNRGGIVNQIVGDGIMCIFGAPIPQEDHAKRAVRVALEMLSRIELFNQEQAARDRIQIKIGIGIATGTGVAGYIGTQTRTAYTCVGDATNLACRLETYTKQVGKPILIDKSTCLKLDDMFTVNDEGIINIQGKKQPVHIFSVVDKKELAIA